MKFTFKNLITPMVVVTVMLYAGCTNSLAPSPVTTNTKIVAGKVASALYKGLTGALGGVNLASGITVPNGVGPVLCGFSIDNPIDYNSSVDTLTSHATGRLKFSFLCTGNQPYGFLVSDTVANIGTSPHTSFSYIFSENLRVVALNPTATLIGADGTLKSFGDITYADPRIGTISEHYSFNLTGLTVDLTNNLDPNGGTATFSTIGITGAGNWNYTGTIVFLGGHMVGVTINGTMFHVNLLNGAVS